MVPGFMCCLLGYGDDDKPNAITFSIPVPNGDGKFDFVHNIMIRLEWEPRGLVNVSVLAPGWEVYDRIAHALKQTDPTGKVTWDYDKVINWRVLSAICACELIGFSCPEFIDMAQDGVIQ